MGLFICAYDIQNGQKKYKHKRNLGHILTDIGPLLGGFGVFFEVLDSALLSIKACPLGGSIVLVLFEKQPTAAELLHGCSSGDKAGSSQ